MPAQTLQTEAFVLSRRPPADAFQSFIVFSPEHGPLHVLQRIPKKSAAMQQPLDLFDETALLLESSNQGRTWFVKETRLITRHTEIGRSYEALRLASTLAALVARNPVDEDSRALNPARYVHGLAAAARRAGALIVGNAAVEKMTQTGAAWTLKTDTGEVRARDVLVATNGYTDRAAPALQRRLIPIGSYVVTTAPLSAECTADSRPSD